MGFWGVGSGFRWYFGFCVGFTGLWGCLGLRVEDASNLKPETLNRTVFYELQKNQAKNTYASS